MSKLNETNMLIDTYTRIKEHGIEVDNHAILLDIAKSLAIIADSMTREAVNENDINRGGRG